MLLPSDAACLLVQMSAKTLRDVPAYRRMSRHAIGDLSMSRIASVPQAVTALLDDVPPDATESLQVQLVHSGRLILQQDDRQTAIRAGELIVYDVSRPFDFLYPEEFRTTILQLPTGLVGLSNGTVHALAERPVSRSSAAGVLVSTLVQRADAANDALSENSRRAVSRAVVDALRMLARGPDTGLPTPTAGGRGLLVRQALGCVRARVDDPGLSVVAVAQELHVSVRALHAAFEDEPETLGQLIRRLRLDRARQLLAASELPVQVIAQQIGHLDVTHFIRTFKAAEGLTPSQWRRRQRGSVAEQASA